MIGRERLIRVGALALVAAAAACTRAGAPGEDITTVRSALNSTVVVTVRDGANVVQPNIEVFALDNAGNWVDWAVTNASGEATLSVPAGSYRFSVEEAGSDFYSGAVGHCVTPACTTAAITVTRVDVFVVDTNGTPLGDRYVWWETPQGATGGYVEVAANGHALVAVPAGAYAFYNEVNGWEFPSGPDGHCVVPTCTSATILETLPVAVTVVNTSGVPQPNVTVAWEDGQGAMGGWLDTGANGVVMLSVSQGAITFKVDPDLDVQFSSAVCQVPGCTSSTVTMSAPVAVTVTDTSGAPIVGKKVYWEDAAGTAGSGTNTNASGVATLTPPLEPVRFKITVDGTTFYSATSTNCVQPACTTASILVSTPTVVTVVDGAGAPVASKAVTPLSDEGITAGNKTTNASGQATFRLPFAHWRFRATCSGTSEQFWSGNAGHCFLPGGCATANIKMPCGQCTGQPNGTACDDQTTCSGTSICQSQKCTGASPMSCSASDTCHDVGACGTEAGTCSNPPKANGSACNDNDACTGTSSCQAGVCTGGSPVTCTASDQCHVAGTCNPATGVCSNPPKSDGSACSDGDNCTGSDTCQAGSCTPGANTCGGIAVIQTLTEAHTAPVLSATFAPDREMATPGDAVAFTSIMTNTGSMLHLWTEVDVHNTGTSPFVAGAYRLTLEYEEVGSGAWIPFARRAHDANNNLIPETTLTQIVFNVITPFGGNAQYMPFGIVPGTSIPPDGHGHWVIELGPIMPAEMLALLFDPAQSSGIRVVTSFDVPSSTAQSGSVAIDFGTTNFDVTDITADLLFRFFHSEGHVPTSGPLTSSVTGPLAPGESRVFTGIFAAPTIPPFPLYAGETEGNYRARLHLSGGDYVPRVSFNGQSPPHNPTTFWTEFLLPVELPTLAAMQKTGPATVNAGFTGQYSVTLPNTGRGVAKELTIADSIDGESVTVSNVSLPVTVAAGASATGTFRASSALGRPPGPMTDVAALTWQDRNGNVYGPLTTSFTNSSTPGHPEGYLSLAGLAADVPHLIGTTQALTVTALDPYGGPAPGVTVHFTVTGPHAQTADIVTGADGKATLDYTGATIGIDTAVASATITTTAVTTNIVDIQWATAVGTPCTGRATPLDVMLVVDVSASMVLEPPGFAFAGSAGKLEAARAAGERFIDDLTYPRDQVGVLTFMAGTVTSAQLGTDTANAKTQLGSGISTGIFCSGAFCPGTGSDVANALNLAIDELEGPRHRPEATKVVVYIGDGGADADPTAAIARLRASGTRTVAIGLGSNFDGNMGTVRSIADSSNDYFYSPSGAGVDYAFNSLNQDLCRNRAPFVSAGGNQGAYDVRIPSLLPLQGEVHDDGPDGDQRVQSEWSVISGPGVVTFANPASPTTDALFSEPGTYVLQLEATDGYLTVADRATITVDPDPSIVGANLAVALSAPGPLETGQNETLTATLTDGAGVPIRDYVVRVTVAGANPVTTTLLTNNSGVATFTYRGAKPGTDVLHATALGSTFQLDSNFVSLQWIQPTSGGALLTQGWIAAPLDQAKLQERVPVVLSPDVTLASGTVRYYPAAAPTETHILAANVSGAPGATLATFDTTLVSNGSYVVELDGTDNAGNHKTSVVLVTVTGDYKPGRLVVELTDFTVPIAGLPITIGRRYDSLEKDKIGDFGYGWSLVIGHPRLEVNPNFGVSLTLPNGRRATFDLQIAPVRNDLTGAPSFFGVYSPSYVGEPGVFGTLTQEGACPLVRYNPGDPSNPLPCFFTAGFVPAYAPESYTYTDPYGTAYRMAASGKLKSITDRQGNRLSFEPNGIISSTGRSVTFVRDEQGRITKVSYPAYAPLTDAAKYTYDTAGDLTAVELPPSGYAPSVYLHTYDQHRLLTTVDPRGNAARTSTYDAAGRLATDTDALGNITSYAYNLATRTNTTTYPDTGVVTQTFDARGLVLSETDQLGHTTTHEYDANRNETKRTNALGEETTATYDARGNQTSVTDPTGTTQTTYNEQNLPTTFTDRLGHVTTIEYDDRGLPSRFADELGTRFKFTNSEHGLPITVEDAAGKRAYIDYNAAGDVTGRTDWLGRVTRAEYDEVGHKVSETTARGAKTTYSYLLQGWLNTTVQPNPVTGQPNGYTVQNAYDPNGNIWFTYDFDGVHGQTNPTFDALNHLTQLWRVHDGTTVSYTRDFRGNPLSMTDENGHTTTYEYDKAGNLTKTTFADTRFTTRTYDALNRLASVTDERGNTTSYEYDEGCGCSDRVTRVTDPLGHATVTAYDANGRRSSVTDANNHTTSVVYDVRGHVIETHYADGTATYEGYDPRGRRTSMTDQTGAVTLYGYDDQGQLTSVTDPLSNVTQYAYDLDGNLTSVNDANGHTTSYEYDLLKRKTKRTLPMGQFETFAYNSVGNQTAHTDFRGKTTTMTYDRRDRMLTKVPDPSLGEATHTYTYSPTGRRLSSVDGSGTTTYTYDLRDRMLTKAATAGTLTYTYDPTGNVATIRSSNTNGTSVDYAWNAANQVASVTDNRVGGTTTAAYTPTNRVATIAQPNGVGLTYAYDALDKVTSMAWQRSPAPIFASWAYTHNARGQRLSSTDITGRAATYGYDAASKLTSETITGDPRGANFNGALSYVLDAVGNRSSRTSTVAPLGAQAFGYNANDEISGDTSDANGNTLTSGGHSFAYDFENHLISKDGGAVTVAYDCDGNRIAKTVGGVTTRYLVDDLNPTGYLQILEELVGGAVHTRYTYGDRIVSQTRNISTTPATNYYGFDAHGSITFLTDAAGAVTDSYDYDAWGNVVASTGATPNTRLYTGEEFDPDLGLINLRARQYSHAVGRFLTLDPLSGRSFDPLSFNVYLYSEADPVNRTDPLGLMAGEYAIDNRTSAVALLSPATINTIKTTVAGAVGIAVACGLVRAASGLPGFSRAFKVVVATNPMLAPLAMCAVRKPCTLKQYQPRPDLCMYDCDGEDWNTPAMDPVCPGEIPYPPELEGGLGL